MPSTPIPYCQRGSLLAICQSFVQQQRVGIISGTKIEWPSPWRGGRDGKNYIIVETGTHFHSTFHHSGWTHFPARLRSLATALRDHNCFYYFNLAYDNKTGIITIQRLDRNSGSESKSGGSGKSSGPSVSSVQIRIPKLKNNNKWWDALKDTFEKAIAGGMRIGKITFRGGGTVPIPDSFRVWCRQNGIEIEILDPEQFDEPGDEGAHIESQPN